MTLNVLRNFLQPLLDTERLERIAKQVNINLLTQSIVTWVKRYIKRDWRWLEGGMIRTSRGGIDSLPFTLSTLVTDCLDCSQLWSKASSNDGPADSMGRHTGLVTSPSQGSSLQSTLVIVY